MKKLNLTEATEKALNKGSNFSAWIGYIELDYDLISVGRTEEEARQNLIAEFEKTAKAHPFAGSVKKWVANVAEEDFKDYRNDTWRFLEEYYGAFVKLVDGHAMLKG